MTLIVEDGTIVLGANTYVSDANYQSYATARGYTIGATEQLREIELTKAIDYLESMRDRYKGTKVQRDQPLQFPRVSLFIDGYQTDSNTIPEELKKAQMELAFLSISFNLSPSGTYQNVQSQQLGTLSVSYFNGGSYNNVQLDSVKQFLKALLKNSYGNTAVRL
tara:strand:- start:2970 stop:3461 length:492 start_codon:yes stop_codon:yes gene_type:complete